MPQSLKRRGVDQEMMLNELCQELRNYFDKAQPKFFGQIVVEDGNITNEEFLAAIKPEQYFRIVGSIFNDGVYCFKEELSLEYEGKEFSGENNGYELLKQALKESRETDSRVGYTTVGPHRHDLHIKINGISARTYGSQGQQRSAALSLKMAEAQVLSEYVGEKPVILLDDVMSELDSERQDF